MSQLPIGAEKNRPSPPPYYPELSFGLVLFLIVHPVSDVTSVAACENENVAVHHHFRRQVGFLLLLFSHPVITPFRFWI